MIRTPLALALLLPALGSAQDPDLPQELDDGPPRRERSAEAEQGRDRVLAGLELGALIPSGKMADDVGAGFDARLRVAYELAFGLAIGASVDWALLNFEETEGVETSGYLLMFDIGARYQLPVKWPVSPFVELAFGLPQLSAEAELTSGGITEKQELSESGLGLRIGAGATYPLTPNFRVGLVIDYVIATTSRENTQSTREMHHLRVAAPVEYVF